MNWTDPRTGEQTEGFRERGFLPQAFVNMLALLGWNDGSGQEIFTLEELVSRFSMDRVHKGGARFDFEKAKWFNHEWIKKLGADELLPHVRAVFREKGIHATDEQLRRVIPMVKDRCILLGDFAEQGGYFFAAPLQYDLPAVQPKWNEAKKIFFSEWASTLDSLASWEAMVIETSFKSAAEKAGIKTGELLLPLRIMLVGGKFGPPVFEIAAFIGQDETIHRIRQALQAF
jgi:glutamyl-tRNA synthetase